MGVGREEAAGTLVALVALGVEHHRQLGVELPLDLVLLPLGLRRLRPVVACPPPLLPPVVEVEVDDDEVVRVGRRGLDLDAVQRRLLLLGALAAAAGARGGAPLRGEEVALVRAQGDSL